MEAPDKIYLQPTLKMPDGFVGIAWVDTTRFNDTPVEYIRKDALLEWANGMMTIEGATDGIVGGYDLAMKDLIEHIEKVSSKPKQVRTLEKEFDGYNSIVITLDKHVLESIGVSRHNKVIIQVQRKED